jgi:hypothetical protein
MTALSNGSSVAPTPPTNPSTWMQSAPTSYAGLTPVLVTQTTAANYNATGGLGWAMSSPQWNPAGANLIVLPAGETVAVPGSGWVIPITNSNAAPSYIISSQDPIYVSGGKLPPYSYVPQTAPFQVLLCTGTTIAAGATSCTLASAWVPKTGYYWVLFREGTGTAMVNEERLALFTQGSTAVTWATLNNLLPSAGLLGTVSPPSGYTNPVIQVQSVTNCVTPWDNVVNGSIAMISFGSFTNQSGIVMTQNATQSVNNVRFIGIGVTPLPGLSPSLLSYISFSNVSAVPPANPAPCSQICFDRCLIGNDPNSASFSFAQHGMANINCNYLQVSQCYFYGICQNWSFGSGDTNNYAQDGGWHAWRNNYFQTGSESLIYGGAYMAQPPNFPHDIVVTDNFSHKPASWIGGQSVAVSTWTPSGPTGATGATLTQNWGYPSASYTLQFSDGEKYSATLTNGSNTVSWGTALTGSPSTYVTVIGANNVGNTAGITTPWWNFGRQLKDHFELKGGIRAQYLRNLCLNAWVGTNIGYHSAPFSMGARTQAGGGAPQDYCPWACVTDVLMDSNWLYNIGSPFYAFTGDVGPSGYDARIQFSNNQCFLNPLLPYIERVLGIHVQPPIPDLIVNQNTLITNLVNQSGAVVGQPYGSYWLEGGSSGGTYVTGPPYTPNPFDLFCDRMTFTNNIMDSGVGTEVAFNFLGAGYFNTFLNRTITKNLTINDTTTYGSTSGATYAPGTYNSVPYTSLGFTRWDGNTVIPLNASDWNVTQATTSGSYSSLTASTTGGPVGATFATLQFPLVGGVYIAGSVPSTYFGTSAFQDAIANNNDVAVIGIYPGWTGGGFTAQSAAAAIKAINPNIQLFPYTNIMELEGGVGSSGSPYSPVFNAATTNNWFLRATWPNGTITDADGNAQDGLNQTLFTVAGSGYSMPGYLQWRAVWSATNEYYGSAWAGLYLDNFFHQPRVSADYAQTGTAQTASAAAQNWRNGYAAYAGAGGYLRSALPAGALVIGNVADWANPGISITGLSGVLNGGVLESIIGGSSSVEEFGGWTEMMQGYAFAMSAQSAPNLSIFCQDGSPTNYAGMRYGLCSCALDNAYYYHSNNGTYDTVEVYDEYNVNWGAPTAGPNNLTNGTYSSGGITVYQNGVWRRDFTNVITAVNPRGNGAQHITFEVDVWALRGTQDSTTNNAAHYPAGTLISMPDSGVAGTGGWGQVFSRTAT